MLQPKTLTQNLILLGLAFLLSILLAFLSALAKQLVGDNPINWRPVFLEVINTLITVLPLLAAAIGLPALGSEYALHLINHVGKNTATEVLEDTNQIQQGVTSITEHSYGVSVPQLATALIDEVERRSVEDARSKSQQLSTTDGKPLLST